MASLLLFVLFEFQLFFFTVSLELQCNKGVVWILYNIINIYKYFFVCKCLSCFLEWS